MLGLDYEVTATDTEEDLDDPLAADPPTLACALACDKAAAARDAGAAGTVLAFDTIVVHDGELLGKPTDLRDAYRMLRSLSGSIHEVVTGVAVLGHGAREARTSAVTTPVRMRMLSQSDIDAWAARGELLGCAGAYNIESHLADVEPDQCFQNVAGLPLCHLYVMLRDAREELGIAEPVPPVGPCDAARGTRCLLGPRLVEDRS